MWMLYGPTGYTGELIARAAVARGERPLLAGRNAEKVSALAKELGLEWRAFDLDAIDLSPGSSNIELVLHCAGPFIHTSKPMVRACLEKGVHYLDITGEIAVFEPVLARDADAKRAGVTLLPGAGFDVVPTDCLAAMLKAKLPDANELWLAFHSSKDRASRGTTKTIIEGLGLGGAIRKDGRIKVVPMLYDVREIPFSVGKRLAMTIPWGDVSTAYHTTGIPNIRVYKSMPPRLIAKIRRTAWLMKLAQVKPIKRFLLKRADRIAGPDEHAREQGRTYLWGRVANAKGEEATMTMTVREGYQFTVLSTLEAIREILSSPRTPGAFTPAKLFGPDFVKRIDGTEIP